MINVYYHPKANLIGIGPFYWLADGKLTVEWCLVVKELGIEGQEIVNISQTWLDGWEYIGEYGDKKVMA